MTMLSLISEHVSNWCRPRQFGSYVVVPTYSMYPSNSVVQVFIEGGENTFLLSDGGGALDIIQGAGGHNVRAMRFLKEAARTYELRVNSSGWIHSAPVSADMLPATISVVAECSKSAAQALIKHFRPGHHSDFRKELESYLEQSFRRHLERRGKILGASNTAQTFDFVITLEKSRKIVIDAVLPDSNSINAAIVAHLDLKNANFDSVMQYIVYDERIKWRASDLALLRVGATPIEYTELRHSLVKLVA